MFPGKIVDADVLEIMINNLPIKTEDLKGLIQKGCLSTLKMDKVEVLIMLLSKLCRTNKWSLANIEKSIVNALADILEKVLVDSSQAITATKIMPAFCKLVQLNQNLGQSMTATHLSLACNAGYESFVSILIELDEKKYASNFKKWQLNNMERLPIFKNLVKKLLDTGKCKSKFTNAIKKFIMNQEEEISGIDEDILEVLVSKYDLDIVDLVSKLPPCKALLTQLKKEEKQDGIVEKGNFILS